jgi:hypothetical protein
MSHGRVKVETFVSYVEICQIMRKYRNIMASGAGAQLLRIRSTPVYWRASRAQPSAGLPIERRVTVPAVWVD